MNDIPEVSGVYRLYKGEVCIYVGSSVRMGRRVAGHNHKGKFDRVEWKEVPVEDLTIEEQKAIDEYKPTLNVHPAKFTKRNLEDYIGVELNLMIPHKIHAALKKAAKKDYRTTRNLALVLIEEGLERRA